MAAGRIGARAKSALRSRKKMENPSQPGRKRRTRKEQARMNFTSALRSRFGKSTKMTHEQKARKEMGRQPRIPPRRHISK